VILPTMLFPLRRKFLHIYVTRERDHGFETFGMYVCISEVAYSHQRIKSEILERGYWGQAEITWFWQRWRLRLALARRPKDLNSDEGWFWRHRAAVLGRL